MNRLNKIIDRFIPNFQTLPAGVYAYQSAPDAPEPYRLHLRIEKDGQAELIINASTILHLNQTAAEYAYHLVRQTPHAEAVQQVARRYRVSKEQAERDWSDFQERLDTLIHTPDLDPLTFLDIERREPYSGAHSAPHRLDCALTYRTSSGEGQEAPVERVRRELDTAEWKQVLDKAWNAGIPHVIFTGGEPTLRDDLPELVTYAESLGQVTGLLTDGLRLSDPHYLQALLQAGLDHLMLLLDPDEEQSWEALRDTLVEDIFVTVHLTLTRHNVARFEGILDRLGVMGVGALSLSLDDLALREALLTAQDAAGARGLRLVWDLPVPYSRFHPVRIELSELQPLPEGAGNAWMYVEPDGDVLPAQGHPQALGNLLTDTWQAIWEKV